MTRSDSSATGDLENPVPARQPVDSTTAAEPALVASMGRLLVAQEIQRVMACYSQFVSDRRYAEWAALFTEDGQLAGPGGLRVGGRENLEQYIRAAHAGWRMKHVTSNVIIDSDPSVGRATAKSDWIVMRVDGGANRIASVGRYNDSFVNIAGQWQLLSRHAATLKDDTE